MIATQAYKETRTTFDLEDAEVELQYNCGRIKVTHVTCSQTRYADGESETRWEFYGLKLTAKGKVHSASTMQRHIAVDPASPEAQAIITACGGS